MLEKCCIIEIFINLIDNAIRLSGTVDDVHEAGIEMVKNTKVYLDKNKEEFNNNKNKMIKVLELSYNLRSCK